MMCTINGDIFFLLTMNTWIEDSGASCHITNDDTGLYDVTNINESIQVSSGIMLVTKMGKLQVKMHQVDGTERVHTLWPVKFCPMAGANLISQTCKLSQGNKIVSDHQNNFVVNTLTGNIILDCQSKTHNGWVAGVDFLCKANNERAIFNITLPKKNINDFHIELLLLLRPLASKSPVHSNHVKIAPWVRLTIHSQQKGCT